MCNDIWRFSTLTGADGFWKFANEPECVTTRRCERAVADGHMERKQWPWAQRTVVQYTITKSGKAYVAAYRKRAEENHARAMEKVKKMACESPQTYGIK